MRFTGFSPREKKKIRLLEFSFKPMGRVGETFSVYPMF